MSKMFMKSKKGFTLVELMVVIVILGILVAIAIPVYNNITESAEASSCKANQRTLESALMQWYAAGNNDKPNKDNLVKDYLVEFPKCPTNDTEYEIPDKGVPVTCPDNIPKHSRAGETDDSGG